MKTPILFIIPGACSLGSMIALEWLNIPYQVGITSPEIRASNEFKKVNPTRKVGALKDGDLVVGENLAILLYLADKYPANAMCPAVASTERVKTYQWLSYISSTLHPAFSQVLFPNRFISEALSEQFRQLALERLNAVLEYIEQQLLDRDFLSGARPTIVDGQAYAILRWANGFKGGKPLIALHNYPKISSFLNIMQEDNAVKNALAIEQEQTSDLINSQFAGYFKFSS